MMMLERGRHVMALMRKPLTLCFLVSLFAGPAAAQQQVVPGLFLPPQSLIGNTLPMSGNAVAVPFAQLQASLVLLGLVTAPPTARSKPSQPSGLSSISG